MTKKFAKQSSLILDYGKNGKTLKKFPDGGELKKKKPSERKPIITNNPNDPRLKAYNDSLKLFNSTEYFKTIGEFNPDITKGNTGRYYSDYLPKKNYEKFTPIGTRAFKGENDGGKYLINEFPVYKKPVQPVVYKKPENPSDKDLNDNNKYRELKGKEYEEYAKRNPLKKGEVRKRMWVPIEKQIDKNPQKIEMMQQDVAAEDDYSGYDITPTENKKVTPKPTQDKTDFYIQSLDKDGKQKVKYFNSKKEKDDYDEKLSKDFYH